MREGNTQTDVERKRQGICLLGGPKKRRKIILKRRFFLQQWHEANKRLNLMTAKLFSDYLRRFLKRKVSETDTALLRHEQTSTHSQALARFLVNVRPKDVIIFIVRNLSFSQRC